MTPLEKRNKTISLLEETKKLTIQGQYKKARMLALDIAILLQEIA